jgi:hypothetical protein
VALNSVHRQKVHRQKSVAVTLPVDRRDTYTEADLPGGMAKEFSLIERGPGVRAARGAPLPRRRYPCVRHDVELVSRRGHNIVASHFLPLHVGGWLGWGAIAGL